MSTKKDANGEYTIIRFCLVHDFAVYQWTKPNVLPFYSIQPNESQRVFFFWSFGLVREFCLAFTNDHSDSFWAKRWSKVRSKSFVESLNSLDAQF